MVLDIDRVGSEVVDEAFYPSLRRPESYGARVSGGKWFGAALETHDEMGQVVGSIIRRYRIVPSVVVFELVC